MTDCCVCTGELGPLRVVWQSPLTGWPELQMHEHCVEPLTNELMVAVTRGTRCEMCGKAIPNARRSTRRYCSLRCKTNAQLARKNGLTGASVGVNL